MGNLSFLIPARQALNTWTALIRNGGSACLSLVSGHVCVEGVSLRICTTLFGAGGA